MKKECEKQSDVPSEDSDVVGNLLILALVGVTAANLMFPGDDANY